MMRPGTTDMGRITIEIEVANGEDLVRVKDGTLAVGQVRRVRVASLVDTGATYLILPESIVQQLGLPEQGQSAIRYADQRVERRKIVDQVHVTLLGREGTYKAIVEPARADALLGAIVLEDLDLLIDCRTQTIQPRDPHGIIAEVG